jgi:hypothetical protein
MPTLSLNNIGKPAPRWFRKAKKAIQVLTLAANGMVASWGFHDQLLTTRLQLWCTIGIAAILEAIESLLKDDDSEDVLPDVVVPPTTKENQNVNVKP